MTKSDVTIFFLTVGDSTAVLAVQSEDGSIKAKRISRDHKPTGKGAFFNRKKMIEK